jgi:hypothetical protein
MSEEKNAFDENVRQWWRYDSHLKTMNERIRQVRQIKSKCSDDICRYLTEKQTPNVKMQINGTHIRMTEKKEYPSLTFSYIEKCLGEIIPDKDQVAFVIDYLKEHREIQTSYELRTFVENARAKTPTKRAET